MGFQGQQFNAQQQMQAALANQAAMENMYQRQYGAAGQQYQGGLQGAMQTQNLGMRAQENMMQQNQFGANLGFQASQAQNRDQLAWQQNNQAIRQNQMNNYAQMAGLSGQDFQYNLAAQNAFGQAAGMGQDIAQPAAQGGYNQWLWEQNYPDRSDEKLLERPGLATAARQRKPERDHHADPAGPQYLVEVRRRDHDRRRCGNDGGAGRAKSGLSMMGSGGGLMAGKG